MGRIGKINRKTSETEIQVTWDLDQAAKPSIDTGIPFLDHMLDALGKHSGTSLSIKAKGDLHIDPHHTSEDIGICLGLALEEAIGDKKGITRFGYASIPMDEALINCSIDLSGRFYLVFNVPTLKGKLGDWDAELAKDFFYAFSMNAKCNLHLNMPYGENRHHIIEGLFKSTARALKVAIAKDDKIKDVASTKGVL
ncbi:MAG: imidazoleglycerol-phosphate dehydratase [Planctomycetota bacterium]|nr:MAG: imidazoleglycerol-phosphate dehydratase [Planctomycetota bacterium]